MFRVRHRLEGTVRCLGGHHAVRKIRTPTEVRVLIVKGDVLAILIRSTNNQNMF